MILNYFLEIRNRIILIIISWLSTFLVGYIYKETLLYTFVKPSLHLFQINSMYFISTNLTEIFSTYLQLASFISNQILMIYGTYHFIVFLAPGLYNYEYTNFRFIILCGLFFWIATIIGLYRLILPWSWEFFLGFQQITSSDKLHLYFEAKLYEYLSFFIILYNVCSLNCQMMIILFIYINSLKENIKFIKKSRKILYFFIFIIATLITPPDVISQICIGITTIILYEIIILVILIKNVLSKS